MAYNTANSLSPMMFKKATPGDTEGTRSERWRSKSVENIYDVRLVGAGAKKKTKGRAATVSAGSEVSKKAWREIDKVKAVAPVVACVLPSLAMDFVASALRAVGALPLITEDPDDIPKDLENCKAAVLDISAPQIIVDAFVDNFNSLCEDVPLVVVASNCGVNDRKRKLMLRVLDELVPTVISGRLGDIYAVSQGVIEKNVSPLESLSDDSDCEEDPTSSIPKVVLSDYKVSGEAKSKRSGSKGDFAAHASPVLRRLYKNKSTSPPKGVPNGSPLSPVSPSASPRGSPRGSPVPMMRGVKKLLKKKQKSTGGLERVPTALPMVRMKGQFRETQMSEVTVEMALEYAQKLCVYSGSYVHLYETNVVTNGELVVEITNSQMGVVNLHSILPCSAAVMAPVLCCVDLEEEGTESIGVHHCAHGLSLYHVAVEEAGANSSDSEKGGVILPGTMRQQLIDALHYLTETDVRMKAQIKTHTQGLTAK